MLKRYRCLESGCDFEAVESDDDALIVAVQAHVRAAHNSIELDEIILAGAVEDDAGDS
jgi:predicted small metal-binding protein